MEDIAFDRSKDFMKQWRKEKRDRMRGNSRNLDVAINLFNYIEDTPGMNRALVAEKLGVSQAYLCKLINGKVNLTIKTIERYEDLLSTTLLPKGGSFNENGVHLLLTLPASKVSSTNPFSFGYTELNGCSNKYHYDGNTLQLSSYPN